MDVQNVNLQTALHLAVERQHTQIVRVCIQTFVTLFRLRDSLNCWNLFWLFHWFCILVLFSYYVSCCLIKLSVSINNNNNNICIAQLGRNFGGAECTLVTASGRRPLRSADSRTCLVKKSHNQFGDRCFSTAGPTLWNSLPEQLWQLDITFGQFKRSLKTFMFG